MATIVRQYPESELAKSVLSSLRAKYWHGSSRVKYQDIIDKVWQEITLPAENSTFTIEGITLCEDDLVQSEFINIFFSGPFDAEEISFRESDIPLLILSMFSKEGSYEGFEVNLKKGDIVIDAGANHGLFSLFAAKKGAKKVYAFEPQSDVVKTLGKNITNNNLANTISIIPFGISDKVGEVTIMKPGSAHTMASLVLEYDGPTESEVIYCTTLDTWVIDNHIDKIDFIKADIEGAERNLLQGAVNTLNRWAPRLSICTYHLPDDKKVLEQLIHQANPDYIIRHSSHKLYAYVP